jgi:hypothetical protein
MACALIATILADTIMGVVSVIELPLVARVLAEKLGADSLDRGSMLVEM